MFEYGFTSPEALSWRKILLEFQRKKQQKLSVHPGSCQSERWRKDFSFKVRFRIETEITTTAKITPEYRCGAEE